MMAENDGYNAQAPFRMGGWNYRVISWPDTEPGSPEGQRRLEIRRVFYQPYEADESAQFGDIWTIEKTRVASRSIEGMLVELKRMEAAIERPAISWDEWRAFLRRRAEYAAELQAKAKPEPE